MTADAALAQLLAGSGLTYRFTGVTTVSLEKATTGTLNVPAASVEAARPYGPSDLPPPYAGGQVATGGQLGILGNRSIMDTPFNQANYTAKLAQDQNARTLDDVIQNDPAVRKASSPGNGIEDFQIRGFEVSGRDILLNGLGGISPTNGMAMMTESVERVEVLKGPNALLNGIVPSGSVGGAINLIPKRATAEPITQLTPDYSSSSQLGGHADIGRRFGADKEFGARVNAVYRNGDTAIDHQAREQRLTSFGLDYEGENFRLSSDLGYQYDDVDGVRRGIRTTVGLPIPEAPKNTTNYNNPFEYQTSEAYYGTVQGEYDLAPALTAFAIFGGNQLYQDFTTANHRINNVNGTIQAGTVANSAYKFYTMSGTTGVRGTFDTGPVQHKAVLAYAHTWRLWETASSANVNLAVSNIYNPTYTASGPASANYDLTRKNEDLSFSSYVFGDTLSILDERVQLTLGLRQQDVLVRSYTPASGAIRSHYDESALTPMVGILGKPVSNVSVYANYIEGLQPGGVAGVGTANQGQALPPFISEQYEVGTKWDLGQLTTTLSVFEITQPSADTVNNVYQVIGEQRNRGVELGFFGEVTDGVRLLGGLTFIDSTLVKTSTGANQGNSPNGVSPYRVVLGSEWDVPFLKGFTLTGRVSHDSSNYLDVTNVQQVPSWTRLDMGARYTFEPANGKPIIVRATVNNVLDSDYWVNGGTQMGLSEPLTFKLSTSFNF
jgi:iron complex outermembrane receptor protein